MSPSPSSIKKGVKVPFEESLSDTSYSFCNFLELLFSLVSCFGVEACKDVSISKRGFLKSKSVPLSCTAPIGRSKDRFSKTMFSLLRMPLNLIRSFSPISFLANGVSIFKESSSEEIFIENGSLEIRGFEKVPFIFMGPSRVILFLVERGREA